MREIKFRAYSISEKRMWSHQEIDDSDTDGIVLWGYLMQEKDHDFVLMQYTGLKDKNGREIYEGDILKIEVSNIFGDYEICSEVAYSESKGAFHAMGTTTDHLGDFIYGVTGVNHCQVIGNIHENPELLEA